MEELSLMKKKFVDYIDKVIKNNHISHTYLIEINNYDEDYSYVLSFVKMIFSNMSYDDVCKKKLSIFSQIDNHNYPDLQVIEPDGSMIKKSQLLELQKDYNNKSLLGGKRIYIIKQAEKLNASSANTILKFLEEPEDDIIAILLTDNRYHVLDTILSRCQVLTLKEDNLVFSDDQSLEEVLKYVLNPKEFFIQYKNIVENLLVDKNIAKDKLLLIERILVCYMNFEYSNDSFDNKNILSMLEKIDQGKILFILDVLENEIPKLEFNVNYKMWLDSLFSKLVIGG